MIGRSIFLLALFFAAFGLSRWVSSSRAGGEALTGGGSTRAGNPSAIVDRSKEDGAALSGFAGAVARELRLGGATAASDFEALLRREVHDERRLAIVNAWAEHDPAAVWDWLQAGGGATLGSYTPLSHLFEHWFKRDPDRAMEVSRMLDFRGRYFSSGGILKGLFDGDAETRAAAARYLDEIASSNASLPSDIGLAEFGMVEALPDSPGKRWLQGELMAGWFTDDWKAATQWAGGLSEERRLAIERALLEGAAERYSWRDNGGRLEWMRERLADGEFADLRMRVGPRLVDVMAMTDPGAALQWAEDNLGGKLLVDAVARVVVEQASKDIDGAAEVVGSLPPGTMRERAMYRLFQKWPENDMGGAVEWAMGFESTGDPLGAMIWSQLGNSVAFHDGAAARDFLESAKRLPRGFEHSALHTITANAPEESLVWAREFGGVRGRRWFDALLSSWRSRDAGAAEAWVQANG
jgi:hypothetical protein